MPLKTKYTGIKQRPITVVERFASRFVITPECWEWTGNKNKLGYGLFAINSKSRFAHRIMWELIGRPVDLTLQLDHICNNPSCINPKHLRQVTAQVNVLRSRATSAINAKKTTCVNGHPFDGNNLALKKRVRSKEYFERVCKRCRADHVAKFNYPERALSTEEAS